MKKIITLLFLTTQVVALSQTNENSATQETEENPKKNEIRVNPGMLMFYMPEISYERIFAKNHTIGVSFGVSLQDESNIGIKYMITPQYRMYFGKKSANGFFMEASASVYEERAYNYYWNYNSFYSSISSRQTNIGLGIAAGGKFITKNNWTGELSIGVGTGLLHRNQQPYYYYNYNQYYPRVSFGFGKRF